MVLKAFENLTRLMDPPPPTTTVLTAPLQPLLIFQIILKRYQISRHRFKVIFTIT